MSKTYIGKSGKEYSIIEPQLGKGCEGYVYALNNMPDYVAKVFLENKRNEETHKKLLIMLSTPLSLSDMDKITWPIDIIYEDNKFVGYIMSRLKKDNYLNQLYDVTGKYKNITLSKKIAMAKNLCAAVSAIQNVGQVCGDLNPKNINIDPEYGLITLINTDSYHIYDKDSGDVYRCESGLSPYLPYEIQIKIKDGMTLKDAPLPTYTQETDLFALSVHIFSLIMNGYHPFLCALVNNDILIPEENIINGASCFLENINGLEVSPYALHFNTLPLNIQNLFKIAFTHGHLNPKKRPNPKEWYYALSDMEKNLNICSKNNLHEYSHHLSTCPWCEIEDKMKIVLEPNEFEKTQVNMQKPVSFINEIKPNMENTNVYGNKAIDYMEKTTILPPVSVLNTNLKSKKNYIKFLMIALVMMIVLVSIIITIHTKNYKGLLNFINKTTEDVTNSTTQVTDSTAFNINRLDDIIKSKTAESNVSVSLADFNSNKIFTTKEGDSSFVSTGFYLPIYYGYMKKNMDANLNDYIYSMMKNMDNNAANIVINSLGGNKGLNTILNNNGFIKTIFNRRFGDIEASNQGYENYTSANDASKIMLEIYKLGGYENMDVDLRQDGIDIPSGVSVYAHRGQGIKNSYNVFAFFTTQTSKYGVCILTKDTGKNADLVKTNSVSIISELLKDINYQMNIIYK